MGNTMNARQLKSYSITIMVYIRKKPHDAANLYQQQYELHDLSTVIYNWAFGLHDDSLKR